MPPLRMQTARPLPDTWLDVDLNALAANTLAVRQAIGHARLCAVVKKNAYGLGAEQVAHKLVAAGADMLAVWSEDEARQLVTKAITAPILVLGSFTKLARTDALYRHASAGRLHVAVHDLDQMAALNNTGHTYGLKLPIHLYLDTGMSRSGFTPEAFAQAIDALPKFPYLKLAGLYTHFATADNDPPFAERQLAQFMALCRQHASHLTTPPVLHAANSFSMLRGSEYHLDMVRPGLLLYGYAQAIMSPGPSLNETLEKPLITRPIARWMSKVIHVQEVPADSPVGYGSTVRTQRPTVIGVVPVGYADGYPLSLSNRGITRVFDTPKNPGDRGRVLGDAHVMGRVNMDQMTIDLTDLVRELDDPNIQSFKGMHVELYSPDPLAPNALPAMAELADSHPNELLCRIAPEIPRTHTRA